MSWKPKITFRINRLKKSIENGTVILCTICIYSFLDPRFVEFYYGRSESHFRPFPRFTVYKHVDDHKNDIILNGDSYGVT